MELATIGHNNPPTEIEILKQRLDAYTEEKEQFNRLAAKQIPAEISDDKEAGQVSDHLGFIKKLADDISKIHKKEKQPFWDAGKAADDWKNKFIENLDALTEKAAPVMLKWNKKKEAEEVQRQLDIAKAAREAAEALAIQAEAHADAGIEDTANELLEAAIKQETKADMIQNNSDHVKVKSRGTWSSSSIKKTWVAEIESKAAIDVAAILKYLPDDELVKAANRAIKDGARKITGFKIYEKEELSTR